MNALLVAALGIASLSILAIAWLAWQLLRQNGRVLLRLEEVEKRLGSIEFGEGEGPKGLALGSEAPAFELPDLSGQRKSLTQHGGQPLLLIFFNPDCGFCREMMPWLANLTCSANTHSHTIVNGAGLGRPLVVIITTGDAETNRRVFDEHQLNCPVLLQNKMEIAAAYKANGTPGGYLIDEDGKIASELAIGAEALLALAERKAANRVQELRVAKGSENGDGRENRFREHSLARSKIKRDGLKAGTPAPDFALPLLDGRGELLLSELRGRRVLLVFSSPSCGPCNTLAPQLEKFHCDRPELQVVMVSKGEAKENRAKVKEHGLTFPIVLQQQWEISRLYAMFATPIAYLIDEQAVIAHEVAVGIDAILALLANVGVPVGDAHITSAANQKPSNKYTRKETMNNRSDNNNKAITERTV